MNLTEQLHHLDDRKKQLDIQRQTLDNDRIRQAQNVEFLYESNRIEGNTLTLRETHMVVCGGKSGSGSGAVFGAFILKEIIKINYS